MSFSGYSVDRSVSVNRFWFNSEKFFYSLFKGDSTLEHIQKVKNLGVFTRAVTSLEVSLSLGFVAAGFGNKL